MPSITAGGYFLEFTRLLRDKHNLTVTVHNHGHGATEITYTLFCVDVDRYQPDLVLIDFSGTYVALSRRACFAVPCPSRG